MTAVGAGPVVVGVARYQPTALAFAVAEADRRNADLRVVHAAWLSAPRPASEEDRDKQAAGQALLDEARRFVEKERRALAVEYVLSSRPPITTLMSEADNASCVVLGADGLSWFDKLLGGEVATWIARHAACPVFVVPETMVDQDPSGPVVAALDVETATSNVLGAAFEAAALRRADLQILHVTRPDLSRESKADAWALLDQAIAEFAAAEPSVSLTANVVAGKVDDVLVEASQRAALLVLGRPRPLGTSDLLARPIAMHVLREAQCAVLLAPLHEPGP